MKVSKYIIYITEDIGHIGYIVIVDFVGKIDEFLKQNKTKRTPYIICHIFSSEEVLDFHFMICTSHYGGAILTC